MADQRIHGALALAAAAILAVGFVGWRSLRVAPAALGAPAAIAGTPDPGLAGLMAFASPVPDSLRSVGAPSDSLVLRRDPFVAQPMGHVAAAPRAADEREPAPRIETENWHVTTTLVSGSRRAALINDALVYVGDPLPDGSRLTTVERDHVVVTDQKGAAHRVAVARGDNG
jgi:hypothetical protein